LQAKKKLFTKTPFTFDKISILTLGGFGMSQKCHTLRKLLSIVVVLVFFLTTIPGYANQSAPPATWEQIKIQEIFKKHGLNITEVLVKFKEHTLKPYLHSYNTWTEKLDKEILQKPLHGFAQPSPSYVEQVLKKVLSLPATQQYFVDITLSLNKEKAENALKDMEISKSFVDDIISEFDIKAKVENALKDMEISKSFVDDTISKCDIKAEGEGEKHLLSAPPTQYDINAIGCIDLATIFIIITLIIIVFSVFWWMSLPVITTTIFQAGMMFGTAILVSKYIGIVIAPICQAMGFPI
jgi:hypothetical protein